MNIYFYSVKKDCLKPPPPPPTNFNMVFVGKCVSSNVSGLGITCDVT
jgi:hypothetical protein